jgi:hypothetical protein
MSEKVGFIDEELEKKIKEDFSDKLTPEFINMLRLGKAAYEHGYYGFISKEKVLEWVSKMYDGGKKQKLIRQGMSHGKIITDAYDVLNAASFLDLFGKDLSYLSK